MLFRCNWTFARASMCIDLWGAVSLNLFPVNEVIHNEADACSTSNYTVGAHGNRRGKLFGIDGKELSAVALALMIHDDKNYKKGQEIDLLVCGIAFTDEFMQDLANYLGVTVNGCLQDVTFPSGVIYAGTDKWVDPDVKKLPQIIAVKPE